MAARLSFAILFISCAVFRRMHKQLVKAANGCEIEIVNRGGSLFSSDIKMYSVRPGCFFDYRFFGDICFISEGERIKEIRWKIPTGELTWVRE